MSKKICHITSAHSRYDGRIFKKECVSLASRGYSVSLIVNDANPDEFKEGVQIISTKIKPKNRIERFINTKKAIYTKSLEVNADIFHLHDPDLIPIGLKLKKIGKKVVFDSHEDIPSQIMEKEYIPSCIRGIISKIYAIYEKYCFRKFDTLISVTPKVVDRLKLINPSTYMITNYPIIEGQYIENNKKSRNICFAGAINEDWKHENIINAISKIEEIKYILAGQGSDNYINTLKSNASWGKVDYRGKITKEEVNEIYREAFIGIALHYSYQMAGEGSLGNTKIFEFMEAGLPLICSDYKLWKHIVEKHNCGFAINPNSIEEIRNTIEYLFNNPNVATEMGKNGRSAVIQEYNWKTQEVMLYKVYDNL
ncbi:MAG: glycosyltransferase [Sedimentibacter sp.]